MLRLYMIFAVSGTAGLIYEVVWFQLLRLTLGVNAGSLGIILACFMGGLFIGSLGYARWVPARWSPLKSYALMEAGIGLCGLLLPVLLGGVRSSFLAQSHDPLAAFLLRALISAALLLPPAILMGATLPALSRWIKSDEKQVSSIGRLYASNIIGAVLGAFGAAFILMPNLGFRGANIAAAALNALAAGLALTIRGKYQDRSAVQPSHAGEINGLNPVFFAYALNGAAALAFEVLWSRMLGMVLGPTVYAFAIVLGVFLLALGLGGAVGSWAVKRIMDTKRAFALLQLGVAAAVSSTGFLVPFMSFRFAGLEAAAVADISVFHLICLARTAAVVFPGAFLWGMSFPFALASLGNNLGDPAKPVGYLYAYNTVGAVAGSLGASFLLLPLFGSASATAHLVILPLTAAAILWLPSRWPGWSVIPITGAAMIVSLLTPVPSLAGNLLHELWTRGFTSAGGPVGLALIAVPAWLVYKLRARAWVPLLAAGAFLQASLHPMPAKLYMLGYQYAHNHALRMNSEIEVFQEGATEPVVVFRDAFNSLFVSINGKTCASSVPEDMQTQILLGLIPVLFSSDPGDAVVIGLGAGITAGSVSLSDAVKRECIVELEPKVVHSARAFAGHNHDVLANPKVRLIMDDGRHFIASSREKFGVITSDPVDPWMAGAAALYTAEHFRECRNHLREGGVFMQWLGLYHLDKESLKSILAAFAEAFPDGDIWITPADALLVGSTRKIVIDVEALRQRVAAEPRVAAELRFAFLPQVEDLLAQYLCSCESMKEFLKGSPVNRDGNLYVQFGGVHRTPWNHLELFEMMWSLRKWDPDKFIVAEENRGSFLAKVEKKWAEMEKHAQWKIDRYRRFAGGGPELQKTGR